MRKRGHWNNCIHPGALGRVKKEQQLVVGAGRVKGIGHIDQDDVHDPSSLHRTGLAVLPLRQNRNPELALAAAFLTWWQVELSNAV
eukprot:COSAG02_NODE_10115_length_2018_cov_1.145388_3_plen_86_part_00